MKSYYNGPKVFDDEASYKLIHLLFESVSPQLDQVKDLLDNRADPNSIYCHWSPLPSRSFSEESFNRKRLVSRDFGPYIPCFIHTTFGFTPNTDTIPLGSWTIEALHTPLLRALHYLDFDMMELLITRGAHLHLAPTRISSAVFEFCMSRYSPFFHQAWNPATFEHLSLLLSVYDANSKLQSAWLYKGLIDSLNNRSQNYLKVLIDYASRAFSLHPSWKLPFEDLPSETVGWIVDNPDLWITVPRIQGSLRTFVKSENVHFYKTVVDWGQDLEVTDSTGRTALHIAMGNSTTEMCQYLIDQGANVCAEDWVGATPLVDAVFYGHEAAVNLLLAHSATSVNSDFLDCKSLCTSRGSNAFLPDKSSLLQLAGARGFLAVSIRLIEAGADMSYKDSEGSTIIDVAVQNQHWDLCFSLLTKTTPFAVKSSTTSLVLGKAVSERRYDAVAFFMNYSGLDGQTRASLVSIHQQGQKQVSLIGKLVQMLEEATVEQHGVKVWELCPKCAYSVESLWNPLKPKLSMSLDPLNSDCPLCHLCCDTWDDILMGGLALNNIYNASFYLKRTENESAKTKVLHVHVDEKVHQHQILKISNEWHHVLSRINHTIDETTQSYAAFEMARQWLKCCIKSHGKCSVEQKEWKPTRALDIAGFKHNNQIKLVTSEMIDGPYVALSHRWGSGEMPRTTTANYYAQLEGIPTSLLSKTMRDAIEIVATLGFRYLWVDALCIIQDSNEDWLAEAARMGTVFSSALFTIAVADSENHSQGIFRKRQASCLRPFHIDNFHKVPYRDRAMYGEGDGELYVFPDTPKVRKDGRLKGPLDTRGWVLQEQILSPRILYYGNGELHWECLTLLASESSPLGISLLNDNNSNETWAFRILRKTIVRSIEPELLQARIADIWKYVISNYSGRQLSKGNDKLLAIEGILNSVTNILHEEHIAGMWSHKLWSQLLWWTDITLSNGADTDHPTFSAPTWSWLNTNTQVAYHNSLIDSHNSEPELFTELQQVSRIDSYETHIIAHDSRITGTLVLKGPCFRYHLTSNDLKKTVFKRWNQKKLGLNTGKWWLDRALDLPLDITCIVVAKDELAKALVCLCLVAGEDGGDRATEYRRVGLCHWDGLEYQVKNYTGFGLEDRTVVIV